jgi:hypothetical protein
VRKIQRKDGVEDVGKADQGVVKATVGGVADCCCPHLHEVLFITAAKHHHLPNTLPRAQECRMAQGVSPWDEETQLYHLLLLHLNYH